MWSMLHLDAKTSITIYSLALLTDIADGYVARRTNTASFEGAIFDSCVDFLLVFTGVLNCSMLGLITPWMIGLVVLMFAQFIIGFSSGKAIYDPVGRVFGSFSMLITPICLLLPYTQILHIVESMAICLGVLSFTSKRIWVMSYSAAETPKTVIEEK